MPVLNVSVPTSLKEWVQKHAAEGGDYSTPSEFVRSVLREKKAEEENLLAELDQLLLDTIESGNPTEDTADYRKQLRALLQIKLVERGFSPSQ